MFKRFTLHQIDASDAAFVSLLIFQDVYDSLINIRFQGRHEQYLNSVG